MYDEQRRLLVVRRANEPGRGLWSIPGGRVEPGEDDPAAVAREVAEETGLDVEVGALVGEVEREAPKGKLYVIRDYEATAVGGTLTPGDDATDAKFVTRDEFRRSPRHAAGLHVGAVERASWLINGAERSRTRVAGNPSRVFG